VHQCITPQCQGGIFWGRGVPAPRLVQWQRTCEHARPIRRAIVIWQRALVDIFYIRQVAAHVAKLVLGCLWNPNFCEGGRRESATVPFEKRWWFPICSPFLPLRCLWPFDRKLPCHRRSNQQAVGHFGTKFGEEEVHRYKPNFNTTWKRHEAIACKRNGVDIFCRLSTMHEHDRQTDHETVTSLFSDVA